VEKKVIKLQPVNYTPVLRTLTRFKNPWFLRRRSWKWWFWHYNSFEAFPWFKRL